MAFARGLSLPKGYSRDAQPSLSSETKLIATLTEAQRNRYHALIQRLRCVVCYNQNLAESEAPFALKVKSVLQAKIAASDSDAAIIDWLVAQYGEFILYQPPFQWGTVVLWLGPAFLLGGCCWYGRRYFTQVL